MTNATRAIGFLVLAAALGPYVARAGTYTRRGGCRPGDTEIDKDCTERDQALDTCDDEHDKRMYDIATKYYRALNGCAAAVAAGKYRTAAACAAALTATKIASEKASRETRKNCKSRAPECLFTCEEPDPPCCAVPFAPSPAACAAAGHGYDSSRDCCI